jgi:flagellar biosynthetic protein FliS
MLKEFTRENQSDFAPTKYDIVPLLLNGIIEKINQAKEAERAGCYAEKGFYLGRATGIIDALRNMLNTSEDIAQDLDNIYHHLDLLMQASAEDKASGYLDEALEIVESMSSFAEPELSMDMPLAANSGYSSEVRVS